MLPERVAELLVRELLASNAVGKTCRDALDAFFGGGAVVYVSVGVALVGDVMMDVGNLAEEGCIKRVSLLHPGRSMAGHALVSGMEIRAGANHRSGDDLLWPPSENATRCGDLASCHLACAAIMPEAGSGPMAIQPPETKKQTGEGDQPEGAAFGAGREARPALGVITCGFAVPITSSGLDQMRVLACCLHASLTRQLPLLLPILQVMNPCAPPLSSDNCSCRCNPVQPAESTQKRPSCRDFDMPGKPDNPPCGGFTPTVSIGSEDPLFDADPMEPGTPYIAVEGQSRTTGEGTLDLEAAVRESLAPDSTVGAPGESLKPLLGLRKDALHRSVEAANGSAGKIRARLRAAGTKDTVRRGSMDGGRVAGGSKRASAPTECPATAKELDSGGAVRAGGKSFLDKKSQAFVKLQAQLKVHPIWLKFADRKAEAEFREKSNVQRKRVDMQLLTIVLLLAIVSGFLSPVNMYQWHLFPAWVAAWMVLLAICYTCSSEWYGRYREFVVAAIMLTGRAAECGQLLFIRRQRAELLGSAALKSMFLMPVIYFTDGIFLRVLFRVSPLFRALDFFASYINVRLATVAGYSSYPPQFCAVIAHTGTLLVGTLLPLMIVRHWEKGERSAYAAARLAAAEE